MSIAVSAVIRPSRALRAALCAFGAANLCAGVALAAGSVHVFLPGLLAGACLLAGLLAVGAAAVIKKTRRIDISGLGRMHLTVQQSMRGAVANRTQVELMAGSTVWPQLMLLLLREAGGAVTVLAVLPDSVQADQFRALGVAVRAIAGRPLPDCGTNKIL